MKKVALILAALVSISSFTSAVEAKPVFTGQNYSGVYSCNGNNEQVGEYEVTMTLKLNRVSSYGKFGAYDFSADTANSVTYNGQAVADGNRLALSYRLSEGHNVEYSTGVAEMKKLGPGRWSFRNFYYEPDDSGGDYGSEYCVMRPVAVIKKPKKK